MNQGLPGQPLLIVIAGPNGAGKSTFYQHFLASAGLPFVNADRIARELAPAAPEPVSAAAAEIAARERWARLERGESFVFETVFSDPAGEKVDFLRSAQAKGHRVVLVFIGLESPALSGMRVGSRVAAGGHGVPEDKIYSRFPRIFVNLAAALRFVDRTYLFDNSEVGCPYRFVALFEAGKLVRIATPLPAWTRVLPCLP